MMAVRKTDDVIYLDRGGDIDLSLTWSVRVNGVDTAVDLSGQTFTPFEVSPAALATGMTITVTNGPSGALRVFRAWGTDFPDGTGPLISIRGKSASGDFTIPLITVVLK
jgi:hypothetical protein